MITLTENAATHIKAAITKRGKGIGLRVGTKSSGCSGLSYLIEFCDVITDEDIVYDQHGVKVIVDSIMLNFLEGMEIDYVKKGLGEEGFDFNNPQVIGECGCGHSFSV